MSAFLGLSFIGLFFVIFAILILPTIFFLLTLQRALSKCSPANRTMTPGLVWLQIIPFFGFIWQFFVVFAVANSLDNEFGARRIQEEPKPGQSIGLAMCITRVCTVIPFVGILAGIASIVLWIVYWVKIAGFSRKLDYAPHGPYSPPPYGPGYPGPGAIGGPLYPGVGVQPPAYPAAVAPPATPPAVAAAGASAVGASTAAQIESPSAPPPAEATGQPSTDAAPDALAGDSAAQAAADARDCASCGAQVPGDATFCTQCGAKVEGESAS